MAENSLFKALTKMAESTPASELQKDADVAPAQAAQAEQVVAQDTAPATEDVVTPEEALIPSRENLQQAAQAAQQLPVVQQPTAATVNPVLPAVNWLMQPDTTTPIGKMVNVPAVAAPAQPSPQLPTIQIPEEQITVASTPTPEEVQKKVDDITTPIKKAKADIAAADKVNQQQREENDKQLKMQQEVDAKIQEIDNRVRTKSLPEIMRDGSTGDKFRAVLAITIGGISQALMGGKSNPAIDMFNQIAEQQALKDKLSQEEKESLRKNLFQQAELELRKLEQKTNDEYRKQQIEMQRKQLAAESKNIEDKLKAQIAQQQLSASKFSGRALTPQQEATLTMEERRNIVHLPDGRRVLAQSYEDANEFKKSATEIGGALTALEELQKLGQKGSKFSLKDRARAQSLVTKVVGGLRLPYTGPGVLTDSEREMLINTLGNPLAFFSLRSVEMAKLNQVKDDLLANLQNNAKVRGINEQVTPSKFYNVNGKAVRESDLVNAYKQKTPGLSDQQIISAIRKTIPEL